MLIILSQRYHTHTWHAKRRSAVCNYGMVAQKRRKKKRMERHCDTRGGMGFVHDEDELLRTHSTRVETPNPVAARFLSLHTGPAMSMCIHWTLSSTNCNKGGTQKRRSCRYHCSGSLSCQSVHYRGGFLISHHSNGPIALIKFHNVFRRAKNKNKTNRNVPVSGTARR